MHEKYAEYVECMESMWSAWKVCGVCGVHEKNEKYEECMKWSAWKQCMYVIFDREQLEGHSFFCLTRFPKRNPMHIVRIL